MHRFRAMFLVLCLCLLSVGAFADSVTGQFTIDVNGNPVPSQGSVTFTLNPDGSIAASLTVTNGFNILGFGFNSLTPDLPESNFSPTQPDNPFGWSDAFGTQPSGFLCTQCGPTETWTIDGNYSSVFDVLDGGTASPPSTSSCLTRLATSGVPRVRPAEELRLSLAACCCSAPASSEW